MPVSLRFGRLRHPKRYLNEESSESLEKNTSKVKVSTSLVTAPVKVACYLSINLTYLSLVHLLMFYYFWWASRGLCKSTPLSRERDTTPYLEILPTSINYVNAVARKYFFRQKHFAPFELNIFLSLLSELQGSSATSPL